jgi:hypothetical protein
MDNKPVMPVITDQEIMLALRHYSKSHGFVSYAFPNHTLMRRVTAEAQAAADLLVLKDELAKEADWLSEFQTSTRFLPDAPEIMDNHIADLRKESEG